MSKGKISDHIVIDLTLEIYLNPIRQLWIGEF